MSPKMEEKLIIFFNESCEEKGYKDAVLKNIRFYKEGKATTAIADVEYTYCMGAGEKRVKHYNMLFLYKNRCWSCSVLFGVNYAQEEWEIVHDCDLEDGTPTEWSLKVAENKWYWIDALKDGTFDVIGFDAHSVLKNCKSLPSAKRWVKVYLTGR